MGLSADSQPDLSLGLTEVANCYLEGSGVKKDRAAGLDYLRLAATMGDLGAQERELLSSAPTDQQSSARSCREASEVSRRT